MAKLGYSYRFCSSVSLFSSQNSFSGKYLISLHTFCSICNFARDLLLIWIRKMVLIEEELEYEIDEKGERVLVHSVEATYPVHIRFRNVTRRELNVYWRDYRGRRQFYVSLRPGDHYDINTFATHPWQFTDSKTEERYVINNKPTFRPPPNQSTQVRTNWNITIGVRTLRHTALLTVAMLLKKPKHALCLDLPNSLASELCILVYKLNTVQTTAEHH